MSWSLSTNYAASVKPSGGRDNNEAVETAGLPGIQSPARRHRGPFSGDEGTGWTMVACGVGLAVAERLVAIITRTQDRPITLDRAVKGILAQTFTDWQLVLVSDAGNLPAIRAVVDHHADALAGRLHLIHRERSEGMQAASNHGIAESRSRYLVIHDDDDS